MQHVGCQRTSATVDIHQTGLQHVVCTVRTFATTYEVTRIIINIWRIVYHISRTFNDTYQSDNFVYRRSDLLSWKYVRKYSIPLYTCYFECLTPFKQLRL